MAGENLPLGLIELCLVAGDNPHAQATSGSGPYYFWRERLRMSRDTLRESAAEFLGTFMLIMFGVGVVAQVVLSRGTHGQHLSINLGWGLGVTMGAYVAGGISGAHLNPAVTLALAVHRGFAWRKVLPYCIAQMPARLPPRPWCFLPITRPSKISKARRVLWKPRAFGSTYPQEYLEQFPRRFCRPGGGHGTTDDDHLRPGRSAKHGPARSLLGRSSWGLRCW